jgi:hypothetical protein
MAPGTASSKRPARTGTTVPEGTEITRVGMELKECCGPSNPGLRFSGTVRDHTTS